MSRVIVLLVALSAAACGNGPTSPDAVNGQPFDLRAGATATLPDGLRLTFERVQSDSRCPMDAVCVWAGEATLAISIAEAKGDPAAPRELRTTPAASEITYGDHRISLTGLSPYPRASQPIDAGDYIATFVVTAR